MKVEIVLSEESIDLIAQKVAAINYEKTPKREVIKPSQKDFQYSVSEVAEMSKQTEGTITRHIRQKLLNATKVGKSWKISQENYLKYVENEN